MLNCICFTLRLQTKDILVLQFSRGMIKQKYLSTNNIYLLFSAINICVKSESLTYLPFIN